MPGVVRFIATMLIACVSLLAAPAFALDSGDIIVVSSKGEVHITMNGAERKVRAGGVLELPASVRTGHDGNVELKQGATTVSVGPETLLEFPALEKRGAPVDRIVQPRGNAFYNIGKREGRKLRVETPYLVGVIKGTQFNVAAEGEATTISLFEGLLEVRATDDSDVVDLKAGEIASRKRGDKSISIIKMDAGKAPPTSRPATGSNSGNGTSGPDTPRAAPPKETADPLPADRVALIPRADVGATVDVRTSGSSADTGVAANAGVANNLDATANVVVNAGNTSVDVGAGTAVSVGNSVDVVANAAANLGPSGAQVDTNVGVQAGPVAADLGVSAAVDVSTGSVDVTANTAVDAGPVSADLGTSTSVDLGAGTVDTSAAVAVGAGPVTADLGTSTSVDLGAGTIDTSAAVAVGAGPLTTDVATDTTVDVGSGTVGTAVDVGVATPVVDVDVGAAAAVDLGAGSVDLGLDVAGADVDVGITVAPVVDPVIETVTDTVVDVGGLLDGLIRRPGRK